MIMSHVKSPNSCMSVVQVAAFSMNLRPLHKDNYPGFVTWPSNHAGEVKSSKRESTAAPKVTTLTSVPLSPHQNLP